MTRDQPYSNGHVILFVDKSTAHGLFRITLAQGEYVYMTRYACIQVYTQVAYII